MMKATMMLQLDYQSPYLAFYRERDLYDRAISLWTGSPWCHVEIAHPSGSAFIHTTAFGMKGVLGIRRENRPKPDRTVRLPWIDPEWAARWCTDRWGIDYDWIAIIGFLARRIGIDSGDGSRCMHCSEMATLFLRDALTVCRRGELPDYAGRIMSLPPAYRVAPRDLAEILP